MPPAPHMQKKDFWCQVPSQVGRLVMAGSLPEVIIAKSVLHCATSLICLSHQAHLAPLGTAGQDLLGSQEPRVITEQRVKAVTPASPVSRVCVTRPCATAAWWGGIPTAKGRAIDATQPDCRCQSGTDAERTDILRKISFLCLLHSCGNKMDPFKGCNSLFFLIYIFHWQIIHPCSLETLFYFFFGGA